MPEEKVRPIDPQREMECDCDYMYSHRCWKCGGRGWVPKPSAADAGLRHFQQTNCPECKKRITVEVFLGDAAAPPVPQEAAPGIDQAARARLAEHRPSRYDALPATAPDEAMRVAEQLYRDVYQDCDCNHDTSDFDIFKAAALIRQAGSERERELTTALDNALYVMNSRPQQGWDKWRNAVAEASRLLGGN